MRCALALQSVEASRAEDLEQAFSAVTSQRALRATAGHPREITARPRKAGHEPTPDRIIMIRHDNGDLRRGAMGRLGCGARDDDVHFELNKLCGEGGESFSVVAVESTLDEDVLALDVPQLQHPLEESVPGAPASPVSGAAGDPAAPVL